jgi:hypothetical protein
MNATQLRNLFLLMIILGAAAVLLGALAKLQHWPLGNVLLGGGMFLEIASGVGLAVVSSRRFSGSGK